MSLNCLRLMTFVVFDKIIDSLKDVLNSDPTQQLKIVRDDVIQAVVQIQCDAIMAIVWNLIRCAMGRTTASMGRTKHCLDAQWRKVTSRQT